MRTQQHAPTLGAIVYLAQTRHNSYARDSMAMLRQSVKLLHTHYNARQRDDVLFLHAPDGNVSEQHQQQLVAMCRPAVARFVDLPGWHWELPPGASKPLCPIWAPMIRSSFTYRCSHGWQPERESSGPYAGEERCGTRISV